MDSECRRIVSRIGSLDIQGATNIAASGLRCLELTAKKSKARNRDAFLKELEATAKALVGARPTEPTLRNAVSSVLLAVKLHEEFATIKKSAVVECEAYRKRLCEMVKIIAETGSEQIDDDDVILTHCHSSNVVEILKKARKQGKRFEVIVTETRPKMQGLTTARELSAAGVKVTYCVDSAFGFEIKRVRKMLVGCDAILADGSIVNKIGTFPMAFMASKLGIPVIVAAGSYKFDPETLTGKPEPIEMRDPAEVTDPRKLKGVKIINPAFDVTPAELVTTIITEKGMAKPQWIRELLEVENV